MMAFTPSTVQDASTGLETAWLIRESRLPEVPKGSRGILEGDRLAGVGEAFRGQAQPRVAADAVSMHLSGLATTREVVNRNRPLVFPGRAEVDGFRIGWSVWRWC